LARTPTFGRKARHPPGLRKRSAFPFHLKTSLHVSAFVQRRNQRAKRAAVPCSIAQGDCLVLCSPSASVLSVCVMLCVDVMLLSSEEFAACADGCQRGTLLSCEDSCKGKDCSSASAAGHDKARHQCLMVCNPMHHRANADTLHPACVEGCQACLDGLCRAGLAEYTRMAAEMRALKSSAEL
jgi:hypothetical protein